MRYLTSILTIFLCASATAQEDAPRTPLEEDALVDTLDQDNLQEAIRILLKNYIKRDSLDSLELNRAAMQGLLARSGFGVTLVDRKAEDEESRTDHKLVAEPLNKTTAYLRPGTFSESEVKLIAEKLDEFSKSGVKTLVLDLRVPAKAASFYDASRFLNHFCPGNQLLFKILKPGAQRPELFQSKPASTWDGGIVLLIDQQTPPAAEAIAEVIRREREPVIIGEATPGQTVEYEKAVISESAYLRFAVAEVIFADGTSIFREGVKPDLRVRVPIADKAYIFHASESKGMSSFLFSKQQPRLNEAALVAGTNPELDYAIAKSAGRDTGYDNIPIQDRVVQAALDYLVTTEILSAKEK